MPLHRPTAAALRREPLLHGLSRPCLGDSQKWPPLPATPKVRQRPLVSRPLGPSMGAQWLKPSARTAPWQSSSAPWRRSCTPAPAPRSARAAARCTSTAGALAGNAGSRLRASDEGLSL